MHRCGAEWMVKVISVSLGLLCPLFFFSKLQRLSVGFGLGLVMDHEPGLSIYVSKSQVLLENDISISNKLLSRGHGVH